MSYGSSSLAPLSSAEALRAAWSALAGQGGSGEGWRTIPLATSGEAPLLAGRRFPGDEEAVLVGFSSASVPPDHLLPRGRGFRVEKITGWKLAAGKEWVCLSRDPGGTLDLFSSMAGDVAELLSTFRNSSEQEVLQVLLGRIQAWQDFMARRRDCILSPDAEVGLFGELWVMKSLLGSGVGASTTVEAWFGPLDGSQDFVLGRGAIEVKTTLAVSGFPVIVSSLEQLDESVKDPLFVAAVRLELSETGATLPEMAAAVRLDLDHDPEAVAMFDGKVTRAGLFAAFADQYRRRFIHTESMYLPVDQGFPHLSRTNVEAAIRKARYEVDLDPVRSDDVGLKVALTRMGII